jgi:hypothetical protein
MTFNMSLVYFLFRGAELGFEFRTSCLLERRHSKVSEAPHQPFFVLDIFKIVSHELFALDGLKLRSS